ncbi:MAG: hypothetical protein Q9213_006256 [Squamulea squamosa]
MLEMLLVLEQLAENYLTESYSYHDFNTLRMQFLKILPGWLNFEKMINKRVSAIEIEFKTNSYSNYSDSADTFAMHLNGVNEKVKMAVGRIRELEDKILWNSEEYVKRILGKR